MADKTTEYKVKSIYFTKSNFEYLDFAVEQSEILKKSFSDYIIEIIKEKKEQGGKIPEYMEKYINEFLEIRIEELLEIKVLKLLKQYATTSIQDNIDILKEIKEEIKDEFDPDAKAALDQFNF